jgi:hypothetical protein
MEYDDERIEEVVLALLGVFEFDQGRVWKGYDFGVIDALHSKGYITDPRGRSKSICLTDEGMQRAKELADKHFGKA